MYVFVVSLSPLSRVNYEVKTMDKNIRTLPIYPIYFI
jgi:hypothetical protein